MEKFYILKLTINKEQNQLRLDQALAKLSNFTRSQIKILLLSGKVKKNEKIFKETSYRVKINEEYFLDIITAKEEKFEAENIPLDIIYEDDHIIIINKIAGIVTHPAPGNRSGTLVNALLNYTKNNLSNISNDNNENNRPGIVHRLDKETSGLMVIAKNNDSHLNLAEQFKDHSISRKYKAIVWGVPDNQIIEGYVERHKINRKKMSLNNQEKGRYSKTIIKLLSSYKIASLVECKLETGRTHQVRLHMTSINSPLIGDKVYGRSKINQFGREKDSFNKFLILKNFSRQALHAYHLGFKHPKTNIYMEFNNEIPVDMQNLIDLITKY
jgi:23S rRNA pseudouridine1911/1915/1917 synthase